MMENVEFFQGVIGTAIFTFAFLSIGIPLFLSVVRYLGVYTVVEERFAKVFTLFGKVELVLTEPGFYFLWPRLTWKALIMNSFGRCYTVDMRLDQQYLRGLAVNSEEGAPMGLGVWYEMLIKDPVAYLFKNDDPRRSLSANVSNSTIRSLSNMPLSHMLIDRHNMSATVRGEISSDAGEWGYQMGSVYIRKVNFRDPEMIHQIEGKVVNRLRQVTSAIKQDGANQVNVITSSAQKTAAVEFAKAAAMRPKIVGAALQEINRDPEVAQALFQVLEVQNVVESDPQITLVPRNSALLSNLLAGNGNNTLK